jgi:hypothetical protein
MAQLSAFGNSPTCLGLGSAKPRVSGSGRLYSTSKWRSWQLDEPSTQLADRRSRNNHIDTLPEIWRPQHRMTDRCPMCDRRSAPTPRAQSAPVGAHRSIGSPRSEALAPGVLKQPERFGMRDSMGRLIGAVAGCARPAKPAYRVRPAANDWNRFAACLAATAATQRGRVDELGLRATGAGQREDPDDDRG